MVIHFVYLAANEVVGDFFKFIVFRFIVENIFAIMLQKGIYVTVDVVDVIGV